MYPILIDLGKFELYTYGLFVGIGFLTAIWVSKKIAKPHGISPEIITDTFFVILVASLLGARLLYILINWDAYKNNFLDIFKIWNGGLVFFGGFVMAVIAMAIYLRIKKLNFWLITDIISPGVALGHALGRMGCLFAGCCYGRVCDLPIAIKFTHPETLAPIGVSLHPTQVYMVISNLILFFILLKIQKIKKFNGMVFLSHIMLYSLFRSIIEHFRGDFRGDFFFEFISLSQGIGLSVSVIAFLLLIKLSRPGNRNLS